MLTDSQKTSALKMIVDALVESVQASGKFGVPAGTLYAALMTYGCSLDQFETIMGMLERLGKVRKSGQVYFSGEGVF